MNLDFYLFQKINNLVGIWPWLDSVDIFFAKYLGYVLIFCLFLLLIKNFKKYLPMVIQAFLAAILARLIIVETIRWILPKPRPFVENHVKLLFDSVDSLNSSAFPSGHAAFFFALSTVVFLYLKKVHPSPKFWWGAGILFFGSSFLISISRVFCGVHWPGDILIGAVVGIFSGWIIFYFSQKFFSTAKK